MSLERYRIQITMLEWSKISASQQPKSLGISPSDLASKSLGVKIENDQVTWRENAKWLGLQDRREKTGPGLCQAIIWTNSGILLIQTLGTNFSEFTSEIHTSSIKKIYLKILSAKWRQFCLCLNELTMTSKPSVPYPWVVWSSFIQIIGCHLLRTKPLPKTILTYCLVDSQ